MRRDASRSIEPRRDACGLAAAALLTLVALATCAPAVAAGDAPTAEQVLDGYVEASGGKAAYARIENRVTRGKLEIAGQNIEMRLTVWAARPNKTYLTLDSEVTGQVERGTVGDLAWENSAMLGPQIKEGQEKADLLREALFDRWPAWREVYSSVDYAGVENVKDRPAHKIVATPVSGKPQTLYFDQANKLLVRMDLTVENPMGSIPVRSYYGDYRTVDGLLLPFGETTEMLGQTLSLVGESVEHNVDLLPGRFDPPAPIREILEGKTDSGAEVAAPDP